MSRTLLENLIETATESFGGRRPQPDVRLPNPLTRSNTFGSAPHITIPALWTKDGFRPQWDNLAAVAGSIPDSSHIQDWSQVLSNLAIGLGVFALDDKYIFLSPGEPREKQAQRVVPENLPSELARRSKDLFTRRAIGELRTGQLSFADLEDEVSPGSFSYHLRHYADLSQSLQNAIEAALRVEWERGKLAQSSKGAGQAVSTYDSVLMVAIAYLAARILEDKGFFGQGQLPTDNPQVLLERTVRKINGFFRKALVSELPRLSDRALQYLVLHLGSSATFTLVDHRHVGRLYEQAIQVLPPLDEEGEADYSEALPNLQRHYTPVAIADRMVGLLPLERLRPGDRRILDPAAGSGSLLLASTRRLADMSDTPREQESYLAEHVAGNDLDSRANLITQVRYTLARESEGRIFPSPQYSEKDFNSFTRDNLPIRARAIVANPPFAEDRNVQRAAKFVELVTSWLSEGDQFSLILPQSFLRGSTHRMKEARKELAERCHVFEVWQLPEGAVGLVAQQPVCVVLGEIGKKRGPSVARSVIARAEKSAVREGGFLGNAWVAELTERAENWSEAIAPPMRISVPTLHLGDLFHVFTGVTLKKEYPAVGELPEDVPSKRYWKREWKGLHRVWADPQNVNEKERYIRYGKKYLHRPRLKDAPLFDTLKIMLGRVVNRDSEDPLGAHIDTTGFFPDVNVFCICPPEFAGRVTDVSKAPAGWQNLSYEDRLLWLLGILKSETAKELSLRRRESRHLVKKELKRLELPSHVDPRIIEITRDMLVRDMEGREIPDPDPLRMELDDAVAASYGLSGMRQREGPRALRAWANERRSPTLRVTGQVLAVQMAEGRILLSLDGIEDDRTEAWVPLPPEMPGWALDGQIFTAELSEDIRTFEELAERPWALRDFKHTERPYLTVAELREKLAPISQG